MQRVDNSPSNQFVDGDPTTGTAGTRVRSAWLNAMQEEVAAPIEAVGIVLDDEDNGQLWKAIMLMVARLSGQCRMEYTDANTLTLNRYRGNLVPVLTDGLLGYVAVPAAGITAAATGLSADTTYLVYLYLNSGTPTLGFEPVATGHGPDSTFGHEIITGASSKTLVGICRTDGSGQFDEDLIRSWFNDEGVARQINLSSGASYSTGSWGQLASELKLEFLAWAGEKIAISATGMVLAAASYWYRLGVAIDSTSTPAGKTGGVTLTSGDYGDAVANMIGDDLTEGYHYACVLANHGGTGTWQGSGVSLRART